ncbi:hypothetical protein ACAD35_02866 [Clavibacter nebraskensis]|uniref:GNAT family N-acetyltransferase n=2 Tax=Clavibacter nebraskensis TaxID=31963 RepID=A0A399QDX4_9MICO|nr:hypothetical protein DZF97_04990 [Clavibacter nebraskensis]
MSSSVGAMSTDSPTVPTIRPAAAWEAPGGIPAHRTLRQAPTFLRALGVGSALLAHGLARVDADGSAAYLESSTARNRALYLRDGFAEPGELTSLAGARPVAMWRAARVEAPTA